MTRIFNRLAVGGVLAVSLCASTVFAANGQNNSLLLQQQWYASPLVSYLKADHDRDADNGMGLGWKLAVGNVWNQHFLAELDLTRNIFNTRSAGDIRQFGIGVNLLRRFNTDSRVIEPYVLVGTGALDTVVAGDRSPKLYGSVGAGLFAAILPHGLLRLDLRWRIDSGSSNPVNQSSLHEVSAHIGLSIPLGKRPEGSVLFHVDEDQDGIADAWDRCPASRVGARVNAEGCEENTDSDHDGVPNSIDHCLATPVGVLVDDTGCEQDTDHDGFVDSKDRCPKSPAHVIVDSQGCEVDSDHDGIADSLDRCAATPAGTRVDNRGCILQGVIALKGVKFQPDSIELATDSDSRALKDAVSILLRYPDLRVRIVGHTDSQGSAWHNQQLSAKRANAIRDYFVAEGVNAANLSTVGQGESQPIADNSTWQGRADNRRVELHVLNQGINK